MRSRALIESTEGGDLGPADASFMRKSSLVCSVLHHKEHRRFVAETRDPGQDGRNHTALRTFASPRPATQISGAESDHFPELLSLSALLPLQDVQVCRKCPPHLDFLFKNLQKPPGAHSWDEQCLLVCPLPLCVPPAPYPNQPPAQSVRAAAGCCSAWPEDAGRRPTRQSEAVGLAAHGTCPVWWEVGRRSLTKRKINSKEEN